MYCPVTLILCKLFLTINTKSIYCNYLQTNIFLTCRFIQLLVCNIVFQTLIYSVGPSVITNSTHIFKSFLGLENICSRIKVLKSCLWAQLMPCMPWGHMGESSGHLHTPAALTPESLCYLLEQRCPPTGLDNVERIKIFHC